MVMVESYQHEALVGIFTHWKNNSSVGIEILSLRPLNNGMNFNTVAEVRIVA